MSVYLKKTQMSLFYVGFQLIEIQSITGYGSLEVALNYGFNKNKSTVSNNIIQEFSNQTLLRNILDIKISLEVAQWNKMRYFNSKKKLMQI